jgi:threonine dehydratase
MEPVERTLPAALRALVRETPLVEAPGLGGWLKLESLQRTGSFKLRGACVALARLHAQGTRQVIAASAGNHGLGIATAAAALGMGCEIVVPENAAQNKRDKISALGATLRVAGADYDAAEAVAKQRAAEANLAFVSPYDDDDVIAGNGGWLGRELRAQLPTVHRVVVPVGGGGLVAGLLGQLAQRGVEVIGVQPRGATAMARSLADNRAILEDHGVTVCSGLDGGVSERTFRIARDYFLRVEIVEEEAILPAISWAYHHLGQIIEPAAATVIAAAHGPVRPDPDTVFVISGGNLDAATLERALE